MHAETTLPAHPSSPGVARRWALDLLAAELARGALETGHPVSPSVADTASERTRVIVSELVSNAVVHARSEATVALTVTWPDRSHVEVRVGVADGDSRLPRQDPVDEQALGGRGLRLVAALSDSVGHDVSDFGKVVWASFDLDLGLGREVSSDAVLPTLAEGQVPQQPSPAQPDRPLSGA